jgi:uncharacterized protein (TIGR00369 family)
MPQDKRLPLKKPEGQYCFACGTANPIGLNLHFYSIEDIVCSDVTLERVHEGWESMAHGGIVSTILDEIMSWAVMYSKKSLFVTRKMNIKYIRPVFIGVPLMAKGRVSDSSEHPKVKVRGELVDNQGRLLARSLGEFVLLSDEKLFSVPGVMKEQMQELFKTFQ